MSSPQLQITLLGATRFRFWEFSGKEKYFSTKKLHHIYWLVIRYLWTKYENRLFFIMCCDFSISHGLQNNLLLILLCVIFLNYMCCPWLSLHCGHCGWLLKCYAIGIGFNGAKTNWGNSTHFRHPTDEQLRHVDTFWATTVICSLSTLNWLVQKRQMIWSDLFSPLVSVWSICSSLQCVYGRPR